MSTRDDLRERMDGLRATLQGGGVQAVSAPSLFPTPCDVAARMVEALGLFDGCSVLEPSAGTGALIDSLLLAGAEAYSIHALDVNRGLCYRLRERLPALGMVTCADFGVSDLGYMGQFDRVIMNPPFEKGADVAHIRHALPMLKRGGVLVALHADGPRQAQALEGFEVVERLPSGTFSGTGVRSVMVRWRA